MVSNDESFHEYHLAESGPKNTRGAMERSQNNSAGISKKNDRIQKWQLQNSWISDETFQMIKAKRKANTKDREKIKN